MMTRETDRKLRRPCFSPLFGDSEATKDRLFQIEAEISTSGGYDQMSETSGGAKQLREWTREVREMRFRDHLQTKPAA